MSLSANKISALRFNALLNGNAREVEVALVNSNASCASLKPVTTRWLLHGDGIQLREEPEAERHNILIFATATRGHVHLEYGPESFAI